MLQRDRPWQKRNRGPPNNNPKRQQQQPPPPREDGSIPYPAAAVPCVEIDGTKFYSDRFYLNRTVFDDDTKKNSSTTTTIAMDDDDDDDEEEEDSNDTVVDSGRGHKRRNDAPVPGQTPTPVCHSCGGIPQQQQQPPLFDRSALVASCCARNGLVAVLLGTYTVESVEWLHREFPVLFGPRPVPCLILFGKKKQKRPSGTKMKNLGDKEDEQGPDSVPNHEEELLVEGFANHEDENQNHKNSNNSSGTISDSGDHDHQHCPDHFFELLLETQDETTVAATQSLLWNGCYSSPQQPSTNNSAQQQQSQQCHQAQQNKTAAPTTPLDDDALADGSNVQLPETMHWAEITSTVLSPEDTPLSFSDAVDPDTGWLRENSVLDKRTVRRGVHHPKFMILVEASGSLVVVVSTANWTDSVSTDASWVQRFPASSLSLSAAREAYQPRNANSDDACAANRPPASSTKTTTTINDFGSVLANFLQCQMLATAPGHVTLHWFVQRYLGWKSIVDLERLYDFSNAQVQLIATVPGEFRTERNPRNDSQQHDAVNRDKASSSLRSFRYGQQRIADIVCQLSLPKWFITEDDRLVLQPTSFGSEWNASNMAHLARSYLGQHGNAKVRDRSLLERLDIVWPTETFVRQINFQQQQQGPLGRKTGEGFLFMSTETFNTIDLTCLNRMVMFEHSNPPQRPRQLIPHFKSAARLYQGSGDRVRNKMKVPKCEEYLSWFLLTSACLSRGAQGDALFKKGSDDSETTIAYSNFELGVLFCSQVLGTARNKTRNSHNTDRIYCWNPSQCCCGPRSSSAPRLVHLPIPYSLRPTRYVEDEDDVRFSHTPFFHEVSPGTGSVGNMQLTPFGVKLAAQIDQNGRK